MRTSRRLIVRFAAASRAARSSETTMSVSPAAGTSESPMISTGNRRPGFLDLFALVVGERTDLAVRRADDDDVADAQRAVLHEHGCDRTAPAIERRFDDDAGCAALLVRLELFEVGFEQARSRAADRCPSPVRAETRDHFDFAAPFDGLQAFFGELLLHAIGLRVFFIHLVDGDDDRHARRLDMRDRFSVCGMTPSSAATTRIATSVTFAPRARIAVNAS